MDAEAAHHTQIEKLEDQLRSAAEVKVCKLFTGFYVLTVSSRQWKKDSNSVTFFSEGKMYLINLRKHR